MSNKIPKKTHTLIISDLHLGSSVSRSQEITKFLQEIKFKKLILLGDIFESLNFHKLQKSEWEFLSLITKISKKSKVIWVEGNHDRGLTKIFASFTGAKVYKQYKWQYKKKKYLAIHGHQFDNFLINNAFLSILANQIYNFIQLIDFSDYKISRLIKRKSKGWLRLSKKVADRALLYGKLKGVDYIFCGHTHKTCKKIKKNIRYYNSGCWTDTPPTFITLDQKKIEIHKYH
jgi:UDP-2,3-diacylglucosamine pyrophosphatase LpxH